MGDVALTDAAQKGEESSSESSSEAVVVSPGL